MPPTAGRAFIYAAARRARKPDKKPIYRQVGDCRECQFDFEVLSQKVRLP
jgi:hypothetical protein